MDMFAAVKFCWLICAAILIAMPGCQESSQKENMKTVPTPVDLLPADNDINGWTRAGAYDEASDYDGLYALIDGAGIQFIENGFVSAAFQTYNGSVGGVSSVAVHLRIYDQGSETNASAIYHKTAIGVGILWDGAGTEARIDESGLASYIVEFWQGGFFVQVIIEEKADEALNVAKLFASHISSEIGM